MNSGTVVGPCLGKNRILTTMVLVYLITEEGVTHRAYPTKGSREGNISQDYCYYEFLLERPILSV